MDDLHTQLVRLLQSILMACEKPPREAHGHDVIIILEGLNEVPRELKTDKRHRWEDLKKEFPSSSMVFISNRNKHKVPRKNKGLVMYFATLGIIAVVLGSRGPRGVVKQLYPKESAGIIRVVDMLQHGHCLEQVIGQPVGVFDTGQRPKKICPQTSNVVPHMDCYCNIKMSVEGPDILIADNSTGCGTWSGIWLALEWS